MASRSTIQTIRRVRLLIGAPGWIFAAFCFAYAIGQWVPLPESFLLVTVVVGLPLAFATLCWLALAIVGSFFLYRYLCPSCGKPFFESNAAPKFMKLPFSVMFVTKCGHCGKAIKAAA